LDTPGSQDITELLAAWGGGDQAAPERLIPLVYAELKRIARRHMFRMEETAAVLNLSPATVLRDWNAAKAWLYTQLNRTGPQETPGLAQ
jgi:hypothetical protein